MKSQNDQPDQRARFETDLLHGLKPLKDVEYALLDAVKEISDLSDTRIQVSLKVVVHQNTLILMDNHGEVKQEKGFDV